MNNTNLSNLQASLTSHLFQKTQQLEGVKKKHRELILNLLNTANDIEIKKLESYLAQPFYDIIERDFDHPPFYDTPKISEASWADKQEPTLDNDEEWNKGKRACYSGIKYQINDEGYPVNPYFNAGVKGRVIGRHGPNHAVDMGILQVRKNKKGKKTLHILSIIRGDNKKHALCGGFIEFYDGGNDLNFERIIKTQTEEFIEEMVSGSVILEGDNSIEGKMQAIKQQDLHFVHNLKETFRTAKFLYKGPVLSSRRNTNSSWMETYISWFGLNDEEWWMMKGNSHFDYDFIAGDDALDVSWYEINPELIKKASSSHSSYFIYMLCDYMMIEKDFSKDIIRQANEIYEEFK